MHVHRSTCQFVWILLLCAFATSASAQDKGRIARRVDLDDRRSEPVQPPLSSVFKDKEECFQVTIPSGWKETPELSSGAHPWWQDAKGRSTWIFAKKSSEHPRLCVHHVGPGITLELVRRRMADRTVSLAKEGHTVLTNVQEVDVGGDGARGLAYAWVRDKVSIGDICVISPTGLWNITYEYDKDEDLAGLLQMRKSFRLLAPKGHSNLSFHLADPAKQPHVSELLGLRWNGTAAHEQCGWAAQQFACWYLGHALPSTSRIGNGAAEYWKEETPGFRKVANNGKQLPPLGALLVWDRRAGKGYGHIAVVLAVEPPNPWIRVADCNWNHDQRGNIHDVHLTDSRIVGWLVRE